MLQCGTPSHALTADAPPAVQLPAPQLMRALDCLFAAAAAWPVAQCHQQPPGLWHPGVQRHTDTHPTRRALAPQPLACIPLSTMCIKSAHQQANAPHASAGSASKQSSQWPRMRPQVPRQSIHCQCCRREHEMVHVCVRVRARAGACVRKHVRWSDSMVRPRVAMMRRPARTQQSMAPAQ